MSDPEVKILPKSLPPKWEQTAKDELRAAIRKFAKPLADLVARDANEGDTRILITDFLCEGLGFDKFEDLSTEYAVKGEYADYVIRIDKQLIAFIEVKRAAQKLNSRHLRQVETYAVKEGVEWIILTNGQVWQVYHSITSPLQPVATHLVFEVDILGEDAPAKKIEFLAYLHKSFLKRGLIDELWKRKAATSALALSHLLLSPAILEALRKQIRRNSNYSPDTKELARVLKAEVIIPALLAQFSLIVAEKENPIR